MTDTNRFTKFVVLLVVLLALIALGGCRTTKVVTTTETHTDSTYVSTRWLDSIVRAYQQKDSVYIFDSVLITKGDTIVIEKYRYRDRWRIRSDTVIIRQVIHDSVFVASADTIPQVIEVKAELTTWQKLKISVKALLGLMSLFLICWLLIKLADKISTE